MNYSCPLTCLPKVPSDVGGKAIRYDDLIKLKVSEIKELYKSCNVLYVYHNHIDATGDAEKRKRKRWTHVKRHSKNSAN